jgi:hypothetical protein
MYAIGLEMAVFLVALTALMLGFHVLLQLYFKHTIGAFHQALEHIHEKGTKPIGWSETKLNRLKRYVRKTRLIDGEESRLLLLAEVERVRGIRSKEGAGA